jgi:hypothetical protein
MQDFKKKRKTSQMLSSEQNVQVCDATDDAISTAAGQQIYLSAKAVVEISRNPPRSIPHP